MAEDATVPPLDIASPYPDNTVSFDNRAEDHFADVEVLLPQSAGQRPRTLLLHRALLSRASSTFAALFRGEAVGTVRYDAPTRRVEGLCEASVQCDVMELWLRFCYGAAMHVEADTAVAALAALLWLRLRCTVCRLQQMLEGFIVGAAGHSVQTGTALLLQCVECPACHGSSSVGQAVARCMLTRQNLEADRDDVVRCLVQLPPEYLDVAEYGAPHTECSEFSVRVAYLRHNSAKLSPDVQRRVLSRPAWSELNAKELGQLHGLVDPGELFTMQQILLRELERKKNRELLRARLAEREKEDEVTRLALMKRQRNTTDKHCEPLLCWLFCFYVAHLRCCVDVTSSGKIILSNWIEKLAQFGSRPALFALPNVSLLSEESLGTECQKDVTKEQLKAIGLFLMNNMMVVRKLSLRGLLSHFHITSCSVVNGLLFAGKRLDNNDVEVLSDILKINTTLTELDLSSWLDSSLSISSVD